MTTETLVKPATIQEQVLDKINKMQQENLTAKQQEEIVRNEQRLVKGFARFTNKYFGLSQDQAIRLTDEELGALFLIVSGRVRRIAVYVRILALSIPFIGWIGIMSESESIPFANAVRKLEKMLGNSFNPVQILRNTPRWV